MTRIFKWSVASAPALVLVCLAWLFFHVGIAAVFTAGVSFGAGYVARWLDEPPRHSIRRSFMP